MMDLSATEGHLVPTAMAVGPDGNLYVSNLDPLPDVAGAVSVHTSPRKASSACTRRA